MIGSSSVVENHPSGTELMHGDDKQWVLAHVGDGSFSLVNGTLVPICWSMGDNDQPCASISRSPDTHSKKALTYDRDVEQMSSVCDIKHPDPCLQNIVVDKGVLADDRALGPCHLQNDGSSCADKVAIIDISKLIAETKNHPISEGNAMGTASEPHPTTLDPSGCTSPSFFHFQQGEPVRKISFSTTPLPPTMDCAHAQEKPQPPKVPYSLSLTWHGDNPNGSGDISKQEYYRMFRTRSRISDGRRLSFLQSREAQEQHGDQIGHAHVKRTQSGEGRVSAGRYFDALRGPELEELKDSEQVLLPLDKTWPFLLRFPVVAFGICLGLATQAVLWKLLATSASTAFLHVPYAVNFAFWCLALFTLAAISFIYTLKCIFYFEAVLREFQHPVRVNFFFAPWIGFMLIAISVPPGITMSIHPVVWCVFTTPLLILELKVYGRWLSGGKSKLSKVANASTHLSLVGNFVSAMLAAKAGWIEPAMFCWAVGFVHYLVLFVTLYQRLPTTETLPRELHPVFFLFIATPSIASVSWRYIVGHFDYLAKMIYFVAFFLFLSLVVRVKLFCGFRFSLAWWAYTFPMTALACATIHYSVDVPHRITQVLAVTLSVFATVTLWIVFICTVVQLLRHSLFPNDMAIAITNRRQQNESRHKHKEKGISDTSSSGKTSNGPDSSSEVYFEPRKPDLG